MRTKIDRVYRISCQEKIINLTQAKLLQRWIWDLMRPPWEHHPRWPLFILKILISNKSWKLGNRYGLVKVIQEKSTLLLHLFSKYRHPLGFQLHLSLHLNVERNNVYKNRQLNKALLRKKNLLMLYLEEFLSSRNMYNGHEHKKSSSKWSLHSNKNGKRNKSLILSIFD